MNSKDRPTDKSGMESTGNPVVSDPAEIGQRQTIDDHGEEPGRRRNRRAQHKDQQIQWRKNPGGCWPSPAKDNGKSTKPR